MHLKKFKKKIITILPLTKLRYTNIKIPVFSVFICTLPWRVISIPLKNPNSESPIQQFFFLNNSQNLKESAICKHTKHFLIPISE